MHRAARVAWPALTFLVAIVSALVVTTTLAGGADGLVVARALVRVVLDLATGAVLGVLTGVLLVLPHDDPRRGRLLDLAAVAAGVWTVAAAATAFLLYLGAAPSVSDPSFGPGFVTFVADVTIGRTWLASAIAAAVLTAALVAVRSRAGVALLGFAALLAVVPGALQGSMSGDPVGAARSVVGADLVQLAGTGAWIGLTAIVVTLDAPPAALRRAARLSVVLGVAVVGAGLLRAPLDAADGVRSELVLIPIVALTMAVALAAASSRWAARSLSRVVLVLLAGALGFTAGGAVVQPLRAQPAARTSPAAILTGSVLPPPVTPGRLLSGWQPDAFWLVVCAALLVAYVSGAVVLRRRGETWPAGRVVAWVVGVALLGWLTSGGPVVYQEVLVSAHLAQHAALLLPVPLLLSGGAPARLLRRIGAPDDGVGSLRAGVLAIEQALAGLATTRPVPASVLASAAVAAIYGTGVLPWSLTDPVGAEAVVALCLAAGGLVVTAFLSGSASRRTVVVAAVVLLLVESAGVAVLALGSGLLLASWYGAMGWGTDALVDQQMGAVLAGGILIASTLLMLAVAVRRTPTGVVRPRAGSRIQEEVAA